MLHPVREPAVKRAEMTEVNGQLLVSALCQNCSQDFTRTWSHAPIHRCANRGPQGWSRPAPLTPYGAGTWIHMSLTYAGASSVPYSINYLLCWKTGGTVREDLIRASPSPSSLAGENTEVPGGTDCQRADKKSVETFDASMPTHGHRQ